jgi:rubrerythrin
MSETSETSISSDTCDRSEVSDELQQEWEDALNQCQRIQELHTDILKRMDHLSKRQDIKHVTDSISVFYNGHTREFNEILEEIYSDSVKEFDKTGKKQFGPMLMAMLEKCEFT